MTFLDIFLVVLVIAIFLPILGELLEMALWLACVLIPIALISYAIYGLFKLYEVII